MLQFDQATLDTLEEEFIRIAFDLFRRGRQSTSFTVCDRRIRAWCGCSPRVIAKLWNLLDRTNALQELATKERLLWGLHLLKGYGNERTCAAFCGGVDEGTFRRWAWFFITELSYLEGVVVSLFVRLSCLLL